MRSRKKLTALLDSLQVVLGLMEGEGTSDIMNNESVWGWVLAEGLYDLTKNLTQNGGGGGAAEQREKA